MADFTELAATAIANAQADEKLRMLVDTQSALRRLAMLVARGSELTAQQASIKSLPARALAPRATLDTSTESLAARVLPVTQRSDRSGFRRSHPARIILDQ
jgi:hypothetical protein